MKKILTREQYLDTLRTQRYSKYTGIPKSNEALANDVNWGDSLVGRLINSIGRKVRIKFNLKKIDSLVQRLKQLFDELVETSKIEAPEGLIEYIGTSFFLGTLADNVEAEKDIDTLLSNLSDLKNNVESYPLEEKDLLLEKIEEFKKFLEEIKKEESGGEEDSDEEGSDEEELDDKTGENKEGADKNDSNTIFFNSSKKILKSILDIHNMIKNNEVRFQQDLDGKKVNVGLQFDSKKVENLISIFNQSVDKKKLEILRQLVPMIEKGLNAYKSQNKKDKIVEFEGLFKKYSSLLSDSGKTDLVSTTGTRTQKTPSIGIPQEQPQNQTKKVGESFIFEEVSNLQGDKVNPDGTKVEGETHARNAWKKVLDAYNKSGISQFIPQIEELLNFSGKDKKQIINNILKVCKQVVNNKVTIGKPIPFSELIKEGVYDTDLPKAISLFGRILLSFNEDLGLTGAYGAKGADKVNPIKVFVESFNQLEKTLPNLSKKSSETKTETKTEYKVGDVVKYKLKSGGENEKKITKIEGDKFFFQSSSGKELYSPVNSIISIVEINRSYLMSYSKFRKINEDINYESIAEKFNEIFTEDIQEKFSFSESEREEIKNVTKSSDKIVIRNSDSIIEIVRLFQRAWRLHTLPTIPSGRTKGKVSMSVYLEYEYMGTSSPGDPDTPGFGPWRNIELFEKWSDAVWDILSNTKYKTTIFSEDTTFSWAYEGPGKNTISKSAITKVKDKNEIAAKPLGKILLNFITRLINESSMYSKGEGGGNIQKFLKEYFDLEVAGEKLAYEGDSKRNSETVGPGGGNMAKAEAVEFKKFTQLKDNENSSTIREYLKKTKDPKGLVIKVKLKEKLKYLYCLKKEERSSSVWFLVIDSLYFDTSNIALIKNSIQPPDELEVWKFDTNQSNNNLEKGQTFKVESWNVKEKDSSKMPVEHKSEEEPELLLKKEDSSAFFDAKITNLLSKFNGLKERINKPNSDLIK